MVAGASVKLVRSRIKLYNAEIASLIGKDVLKMN